MIQKTLVALTALLLTAGLAVGQIRPTPVESSVRGKIFIGIGQVADGIEVRLERAEMQAVATTYTDGIGNFEFRNVPAGSYTVVVRQEGYDEVRQAVDLAMLMRGVAVVTINLTKPLFTNEASTDGDHVVDIRELQRNYPKKATQEYERALEDHGKGNTARAIERMEQVVKLAPDFYQAHNNLGAFYQAMQRFTDGAKEYKIARELNPRASEPLVNLGNLYIQEAAARKSEGRVVVGRILDDALDILDEAVTLDPQSAAAYYYLGSAYYKSEFLEEAEQNLVRSQQLDPKSRAVRLMLINVYIKAAKWESVLVQMDAYLEENPDASDRAQMQLMRTKVVEGLEALKK